MKTLAAWMQEAGLRDREVADAIGVERSTVTYVRLGKRSPSLRVAVAIERLTSGVVTVQSWIKDGSA